MIRSVFILHESGLCLLSRTYGKKSKNIDLFSGLLVAVASFAKNMIGDNIHEIRMEHHNIFYESKKTIILALITSEKKISKRKLSTIMKKIYKAFVGQYQEHLKQQIIEPKIFEDFKMTIDNILQTNGLVKEKHLQARKKTISSMH